MLAQEPDRRRFFADSLGSMTLLRAATSVAAGPVARKKRLPCAPSDLAYPRLTIAYGGSEAVRELGTSLGRG